MAAKLRITSSLKAIGGVACVYVILPLVGVAVGIFLVSLGAIAQRGVNFYHNPAFQEYLRSLGGFFGGLTLLLGSGLLAIKVWSRRTDLYMFGRSSRWKELLIGISVGFISYYLANKLLLPWLYLAMPVGSEWIKSEFFSLRSYGSSQMDHVGGTFFLDAFYSPLVETIIFVGSMYRTFRSQWGIAASLLLGSAIFSAAHMSNLLFLDFFVFGLANFLLYEFRKSLAASLAHHVTFNVLVYGSQLSLFKGF
jgi:membrane protease YdiL (CAAX protease family)